MKKSIKRLVRGIVSASLLTIYGCGGGGGGSAGVGVPPGQTTPARLEGVAATGAALANAVVVITNSAGQSPCVQTSISTTALGSYTCTLKSGEAAPFFIVVTDPSGNTPPLISVATQTPPSGTALTTNVTPLTTAIVAQLSPDGSALTLVNSGKLDADALKKVTTNVVAQLTNVLAAVGAPAGYDPFTTSITAATAAGTGNTADMLLDVVKVAADPVTGKLTLTTVDNPVPVPLATASAASTPVQKPTAGISSLSQAAQIAAKTFAACFAVPTAQRVLSKDSTIPASQGGPEVTDTAAACQDIVADSDNAAGFAFMHSGYRAGQFFYNLLTNDKMTGAQFSVPEIMAFYPADTTASPPNASAYERAVLNIKYIDADGNPGNLVTVAANLPGTSSKARPTNWWLVGNQQPVDVRVTLNIRRVEQRNTSPNNAEKFSTFQTGMAFFVNTTGPGSSNEDGALKFARISGPGLPGNGDKGTGLVYVASTGQHGYMDLYNKTGKLNEGSQCGNGQNFNCPNLWFSRTKGIAGVDASILANNPPSLGLGFVWAQAADAIDPAKVIKGARYKVELFYGNSNTPAHTFHKTLLSDLIQATQAVKLPWNTIGTQTVSALDPIGTLTGEQATLPVNWVQNPEAQQINGVNVIINTTFGSYGSLKNVPKGATSVIVNNVPLFSTTNPVGRTLLFSYRMLDTSYKSAVYTYN